MPPEMPPEMPPAMPPEMPPRCLPRCLLSCCDWSILLRCLPRCLPRRLPRCLPRCLLSCCDWSILLRRLPRCLPSRLLSCCDVSLGPACRPVGVPRPPDHHGAGDAGKLPRWAAALLGGPGPGGRPSGHGQAGGPRAGVTLSSLSPPLSAAQLPRRFIRRSPCVVICAPRRVPRHASKLCRLASAPRRRPPTLRLVHSPETPPEMPPELLRWVPLTARAGGGRVQGDPALR
eukprot:4684080-Pyramimonas_sp.AAC.2